MTGEDYPVEVDITVEMDDDEPFVCIDLGGEFHAFSVKDAEKLHRTWGAAIEFARTIEDYGPHCEFDA